MGKCCIGVEERLQAPDPSDRHRSGSPAFAGGAPNPHDVGFHAQNCRHAVGPDASGDRDREPEGPGPADPFLKSRRGDPGEEVSPVLGPRVQEYPMGTAVRGQLGQGVPVDGPGLTVIRIRDGDDPRAAGQGRRRRDDACDDAPDQGLIGHSSKTHLEIVGPSATLAEGGENALDPVGSSPGRPARRSAAPPSAPHPLSPTTPRHLRRPATRAPAPWHRRCRRPLRAARTASTPFRTLTSNARGLPCLMLRR